MVVENPDWARKVGAKAAAQMAEYHSPEAAVPFILERYAHALKVTHRQDEEKMFSNIGDFA
jgi:hypothetical protein